MRASNKERLLLLACELSSRADGLLVYTTSCVPLIKAFANPNYIFQRNFIKEGAVVGRREKNVVPNCITIC